VEAIMSKLPSADTGTGDQSDLRQLVVEVREMLVQIRRNQGDTRAGSREGPLVLGSEKLIRLEDAVSLVWGKSAAADAESRRVHAGILELFATEGLNGVILETRVKSKKWHTSREAVERFMLRAFGRQPEHKSPATSVEQTSRRRAAQ
jgi:hypothetical protein